ncbi:hypothetical protein OSL60_25975, partial [Escherichia coli]|nr:hypothetical protein [Escherichia coli]
TAPNGKYGQTFKQPVENRGCKISAEGKTAKTKDVGQDYTLVKLTQMNSAGERADTHQAQHKQKHWSEDMEQGRDQTHAKN